MAGASAPAFVALTLTLRRTRRVQSAERWHLVDDLVDALRTPIEEARACLLLLRAHALAETDCHWLIGSGSA